ncbi:MAG: HAMP domain-containing protein [Deltaproteobacteria bacterium]|nr:HAMP domain-containing protein [Deltaproteobacteria bacterium]
MSAEATGARRTVARPFFFKIALVIAATVSLSLAILGWVVIDANEETLEDLARSRQHLALEDVARSVEASLRSDEDVLETIGRVIVATPEAQADAIPTLVASFVSGASSIDAVAIYAADGERIDVVREADATTSLPPSLGEEQRDLASAQGSLSSVEDDGSVLSIVPLRSSGGVTGFVAARTSLGPITQHIEALGVRHFGNVEAPILLVDGRGRALAGLGGGLPAVPSAYATGLEASRAGSYAEIVGAGSEARLVTIERVDLRPFRIVVSEPTSVVFASVAELRRWVITAVVLGVLLSFAVSWALGRRLAAPIAALVTQADHLAHRRFDRRVVIDSGDELAVLGRAMSDAASELSTSEARIQKEIAIRTDLGRYLPAEIVDRVVLREQDMGLGGQKRAVTVLFADVVGFTPLTEKLAAEDTVKLLNELFTLLTEIVFRHGGTLDKFMGDSVMAIFGAPTEQADHAQRAIACAEDMLRFLDTGNAGWSERYDVKIELAIGVASGECVVGNIGSERRMEYTAIGDVVNTAARLEAIARPNQILVPEATAKIVGDDFELIDRGERELPGKRGTVRLFEVSV